jgi:uncharacterized membrane protein
MAGDRIHQLYVMSIVGKGALAMLECLAGMALILTNGETIVTFIGRVTQGEISEDPHDFVASHLQIWAAGFSADSKSFYAWYFLSHGIVKLVIVGALFSGRLWAFPASIAALALFIFYQVYRYTLAPTLGLVLLTMFDLVVMGLVVREYLQAKCQLRG